MGCTSSKSIKRIQDEYRLLDKIGNGAFGQVFIAVKKSNLKEKYAIKSLDKKKTTLEQFNNEISILNTIDHINIAKLVTHYEDELNYYLVLEYCDGITLQTIFEKTKHKFTEIEAREIMSQLL